MAKRSKHIQFYNPDLLEKLNENNIKLWNRYKIDLTLREKSPNTIYQYYYDVHSWFCYVYENQGNICVTELNEDDLTEFFFYFKEAGNNTRRMKRRMSSISAFYKFLRKKKIIKENPMDYVSRPDKDTNVQVQTFLSEEQVKLMRKELKKYVKSFEGSSRQHRALQIQTYAMLSLSTMARVTAISNIEWVTKQLQ